MDVETWLWETAGGGFGVRAGEWKLEYRPGLEPAYRLRRDGVEGPPERWTRETAADASDVEVEGPLLMAALFRQLGPKLAEAVIARLPFRPWES